ncbi:GDP-mannose 4,6-dehydratase [Ketobacter sp.]|uniref:GDP-mannose 4,6-dehydratase n=1 Tax=Ketobacter sp. TaxID=2083498 RepID=UPI000F127D7E|nr:GDP-mannose 4,6-dehydratase [Ketobacter sp.]RLU01370.1 MAG: NAD-dependent epimerase/dehydratase family protein [Ketobacter sp.]
MASPSKVLVTGDQGFTGLWLVEKLKAFGYLVRGLKCDLADASAVNKEVAEIAPDFVVHLAAISDTAHLDAVRIYEVNVIGTLNLLEALKNCEKPARRIVVASSASVYGNKYSGKLNENLCPSPVSHYGCSKLSMEHMIEPFRRDFDIVLTRPFNYTGVGHDGRFLVPKIVDAYVKRKRVIRLGNLNVAREFNDVRDVCTIYVRILEASSSVHTANICSGRAIYISRLIDIMNELAGYKIQVESDSKLVRPNEIDILCGDPSLLESSVVAEWEYSVEDTLYWMYRAGVDGAVV